LWKLGSSPEFSRRRSARGGLEQQHWTKLNPWFAGDATRERRNPTGWHRHATCRNRDSTNYAWTKPWFHLSQRNSEHHYAGIDVPDQFDSGTYHATLHG
jgi:hypothetical protein